MSSFQNSFKFFSFKHVNQRNQSRFCQHLEERSSITSRMARRIEFYMFIAINRECSTTLLQIELLFMFKNKTRQQLETVITAGGQYIILYPSQYKPNAYNVAVTIIRLILLHSHILKIIFFDKKLTICDLLVGENFTCKIQLGFCILIGVAINLQLFVSTVISLNCIHSVAQMFYINFIEHIFILISYILK